MEGNEEVELEGEEVEEGKEEGEGDWEEEYGEEKDGEKEEDEEEEDGVRDGKDFESSGDDFRPFILPKIWSVNNFLPKLSLKVFNKLHDRFQIPSHIPLRLSGENEKCY